MDHLNLNLDIVQTNNQVISFTSSFVLKSKTENSSTDLLHVPPGYNLLEHPIDTFNYTILFTFDTKDAPFPVQSTSIKHIVEFLPIIHSRISAKVNTYVAVFVYLNHMFYFVVHLSDLVFIQVKPFQTAEEFLYHIRNSFLLNNLNIDEHPLYIMGEVEEDSRLVNKVKTFVRHLFHVPLKLDAL